MIRCSCLHMAGLPQPDYPELAAAFAKDYPALVEVAQHREQYDRRGETWQEVEATYIAISTRQAYLKGRQGKTPEQRRALRQALRNLRRGRGRCGSCIGWLLRELPMPEKPERQRDTGFTEVSAT